MCQSQQWEQEKGALVIHKPSLVCISYNYTNLFSIGSLKQKKTLLIRPINNNNNNDSNNINNSIDILYDLANIIIFHLERYIHVWIKNTWNCKQIRYTNGKPFYFGINSVLNHSITLVLNQQQQPSQQNKIIKRPFKAIFSLPSGTRLDRT